MHSIVILGDKRRHIVAGYPPVTNQSTFAGGVELMRGAIVAMLQANSRSTPPEIWFPRPESGAYMIDPQLKRPSEMQRWEIRSKKFERDSNTRYCLTEPKPVGKYSLPMVEDDLLQKLLLGGFCEKKSSPNLAGKPHREYLNDIFERLLDEKLFHARKNGRPLAIDKPTSLKECRNPNELREIIAFPEQENDSEDDKRMKRLIRDTIETIDSDYQQKLIAETQSNSLKQISPDILVFDDLGQQAGKIKFAISTNCPIETPEGFATELGRSIYQERIINYLAEERFRFDFDQSEFAELYNSRANLTRFALRALVSRLHAVAKQLIRSGTRYPIEPVVILSAANYIPDLRVDVNGGSRCNHREDDTQKTIWQHLHCSDVLRRRTVVLFDAETIRNEISVSSGLSWERTAQDTIVEFKRSAKLKPFLRFGHVIIRYGLTGALLISNDGDNSWNYSLYFNPDQDDVMFTHKEDGVVLGATSVIAATIIEQLNDRCSWRNGKSVLPDLDYALDQAMKLSIQRLLTHFKIGLGQNDHEFKQLLKDNKWFDKRVFMSRADVMNADSSKTAPISTVTRVSVQRVRLLPFRSRYWSILAQSCQTDLNNVARSIVYHGEKIALNTLESPINDFVTALLDRALSKLEEDSVNSNRSSSLFFDSNKRNRYFKPDKDDDKELAEELVECLDVTLDKDGERPIRRLVGDSFYNSLLELKNELMSMNSSARTRLDELTGQLFERTFRFEERLIGNLHEILARSFHESQPEGTLTDTANLIADLQGKASGTSSENLYLFLLAGREKFIEKKKKDAPNQPLPSTDELVRDAYERLREAILHGYAKPTSEDLTNQAIQIIEEIDLENYADPRAFLHAGIVELIRNQEPFQGWESPISTPVLRLGPPPEGRESDKRLTVIDRKEVESIRAVKRMIEQYLRDTNESDEKAQPERPLSIAVFGPPGSGKSIAVKKIFKMMKSTGAETKQFTVNLSQLSSVEELAAEFQRIKNDSTNMIPVVFFDEFDSALDQKYGWLRHFLAIMEDSKYKNIEIKNAVFVFAGGTCSTFEEFSLADHSRDDSRWVEFSNVKGPDFVSRLKGHINMVGINPSNPDDDLYLIRRALALRFQLATRQDLGDSQKAEIDSNILSAFLHVPEYIHGARSMRMLVELCVNRDKNTLAMSEVPPIHQLNMQVDGKAFATLASGQTQPVFDDDQ